MGGHRTLPGNKIKFVHARGRDATREGAALVEEVLFPLLAIETHELFHAAQDDIAVSVFVVIVHRPVNSASLTAAGGSADHTAACLMGCLQQRQRLDMHMLYTSTEMTSK
jgi:hypothetical protein